MAILTFRVKGQTLTVESKINKIVENSVNYLDYEIIYDDKKWDPPLAKKVVVTYDKKTYEIFGDKIPSQVIHAPGFTVSVIGYKSDSEDDSGIIITTYPVAIKVFPSGAIKGTIPEDTAIDLSVAEQLNEKIEIQVNDIKNNYLSKDLLRILINKNSTNLEVPTAKAVYDCVEALKAEIMGDLDEISDLVGGEEKGETITLIETAEYEFIGAPENSFGWGSELQLETTSLPNSDTTYNFVLGEVNSQITFTFSEENNAFFAGNKSLVGLGENTGETYLVGIGLVDSSYLAVVYTSEPAGTYTVGLSYSGGAE